MRLMRARASGGGKRSAGDCGSRIAFAPGLWAAVLLGLTGCAGSGTQHGTAATGAGATAPQGAANASLTTLAAEEQAGVSDEQGANEDLIDLGAKAGLDQELLARLAGDYDTAEAAEEPAASDPLDAWHGMETSTGLNRFADGTTPADTEAAADVAGAETAPAGASLPADEAFLAGPVADGDDPDAAPAAASFTESQPAAAQPLLLLRRRIEAEAERSGTPFYEAVLTVMLDLYADGTTRRFEIPATSEIFAERELAVLRELQEFVLRVHRDVYRRDSFEPLAEAASELAAGLSEHLPLTIPTLALCKRVDGFGQYEPLAGNRFLVNRPARIGIYTELENFQARQDGEGMHRVEVSQTLTLYNEFGTKAWEEGPRRVVDVSRNRRRDFFLAVAVDLPALSIGTYNLKVSMRDENSGALAEKTVQIEVIADPRMLSSFD